MIAIIDYDAGNIKSVEKALISLGETAVITRDKDRILNADKVILPGVGAFGDAMGKIRGYGLEEVIKKVVADRTPFLGICLGLQLLFESSEETPGVAGLGILKGKIVKIPDNMGFKVPQIGWNSLKFPNEGRLFKGIPEDAMSILYIPIIYRRRSRKSSWQRQSMQFLFMPLLRKEMCLPASFTLRKALMLVYRY